MGMLVLDASYALVSFCLAETSFLFLLYITVFLQVDEGIGLRYHYKITSFIAQVGRAT